MSAVPLNETPPIVLGVANAVALLAVPEEIAEPAVVAVTALPVQLPDEPLTLPVTLPVTAPVTLPVKLPETSPVRFPVKVEVTDDGEIAPRLSVMAGVVVDVATTPLTPPDEVIVTSVTVPVPLTGKSPEPRSDEPPTVLMFTPETRSSCFASKSACKSVWAESVPVISPHTAPPPEPEPIGVVVFAW